MVTLPELMMTLFEITKRSQMKDIRVHGKKRPLSKQRECMANASRTPKKKFRLITEGNLQGSKSMRIKIAPHLSRMGMQIHNNLVHSCSTKGKERVLDAGNTVERDEGLRDAFREGLEAGAETGSKHHSFRNSSTDTKPLLTGKTPGI
jgi:hypothetical protein